MRAERSGQTSDGHPVASHDFPLGGSLGPLCQFHPGAHGWLLDLGPMLGVAGEPGTLVKREGSCSSGSWTR